jgi:hypothetical protein
MATGYAIALPRLISDAAAALEKAATAAECLEAKQGAANTYGRAKQVLKERMAKFGDAYDEVVAACRRVMADALIIEAEAQRRLADEYDKAQERGELRPVGKPKGTANSSTGEELAGADDVGLTHKLVHEARKVRDAERAEPGIIRKVVEQKLQAGAEPTRADVKRAVNEMTKKAKAGKAAKAGEPATLSLTARQKLDEAIRQHREKLEAEFEQRVQDECRRRIEETILPHYAKTHAEHERVIKAREGFMSRSTHRKILFCLHPDRVQDEADKKRHEEAFRLFNGLELLLLDETQMPTPTFNMQKAYAEAMASDPRA